GVNSNGSINFSGANARLTASSVTVDANTVACPSVPKCTVSGSVKTNTLTTDPYTGRSFTTPPNTRVSSLTRALAVATATTASPHGFAVAKTVTVAGATGAAYNGAHAVTVVPDATHFKYAIVGTP